MNKTKNILKLLIISWGILLGLNTYAYDLVEVSQKLVGQVYDYDLPQDVILHKTLTLDDSNGLRPTSPNPIATFELSHQLTWQTSALPHVYDDGTVFAFSQKLNAPKKPGWKKRRAHNDNDTGLKDHARRHSDLSPEDYLARGQQNVLDGNRLKGGGKYPDVKYYVRKVGDNDYSITITDKKGDILSIDTWKHGSNLMTKQNVIDGLRKSGVTPPKNFWDKM